MTENEEPVSEAAAQAAGDVWVVVGRLLRRLRALEELEGGRTSPPRRPPSSPGSPSAPRPPAIWRPSRACGRSPWPRPSSPWSRPGSTGAARTRTTAAGSSSPSPSCHEAPAGRPACARQAWLARALQEHGTEEQIRRHNDHRHGADRRGGPGVSRISERIRRTRPAGPGRLRPAAGRARWSSARCSTRSTLDARGRADPPSAARFGAPPADGLASSRALPRHRRRPAGHRPARRRSDRAAFYLVGTALVGVAGSLSACSPRPCGCWSSLRVLLLRHLRRLSRVDVAAAHRVGAHRTEEPQRHPSPPRRRPPRSSLVVGPTPRRRPHRARLAILIFGSNVPPSAASSGPRRAAPAQDPAGRAWSDARAPTYPMALFGRVADRVHARPDGARPRARVPADRPAAGALFVRRERGAAPFLDLRVLGGNGPPLATYARQLPRAYTTAHVFPYGYAQWLQEGRGLSARRRDCSCRRCRWRRSPSLRAHRPPPPGAASSPRRRRLLPTRRLCLPVVPRRRQPRLAARPGRRGLRDPARAERTRQPERPARPGRSGPHGVRRASCAPSPTSARCFAAAANAAFFQDGAPPPARDRTDLAWLARRGRRRAVPGHREPSPTKLAAPRRPRGVTLLSRLAPVSERDRSHARHRTSTPPPHSSSSTSRKGLMGVPATPAWHGRRRAAHRVARRRLPRRGPAPSSWSASRTRRTAPTRRSGRTDTPQRGGTPPEGWDEVVDVLAGHPGDIVVTKRNWSAFYGTDLDLQLRRRGVTQIVLTGVATQHRRGVHGPRRPRARLSRHSSPRTP